MHLSDAPIAHQFTGAAKMRIGALLAAGLEHASVLFYRVAHGPPLRNRERKGLLAINVFARFTRFDHGNGVPMVGRGDFNGVYVGAGQQGAKIFVRVAAFIRPCRDLLLVFLIHKAAGRFAPAHAVVPVACAFPVHVAHGHHLNALVFEKLAQIADALIARADHAQRNAVARRNVPIQTKSGGGDNGGKPVPRCRAFHSARSFVRLRCCLRNHIA